MKIIINENYNGCTHNSSKLVETGVAIGGKARFGYKSKLNFSYIKYLKEQEEQEDLREFVKLKHKLDYEYKTYGEIDEVDFLRYQQLANKIYNA